MPYMRGNTVDIYSYERPKKFSSGHNLLKPRRTLGLGLILNDLGRLPNEMHVCPEVGKWTGRHIATCGDRSKISVM